MAFTTGNLILPGYEMPVGTKEMVCFDHTGPASYVVFVPATQLGGDIFLASSLGRGGFDYLDSDAAETTGQIQVFAVYTLAGSGNAIPQVTLVYFSLVTAALGGQAQTAGTQIVVATNLSTFSWRLRAMMV